MSDYSDADGVKGQVENESYCMKKSFQARNVDEMTQMSGYHNMADLANTKKVPVSMEGARRNEQEGPKAANNKYDY